jgi:hypothetical protein
MSRSVAFSILAAASLGGSALAQSSPVIGAWDTTLQTPGGVFSATMTFAEAEGGYTVEIDDVPYPGYEPVENGIGDIVVEGDSFSFKRTMNSPEGPFDISYTGAVDGDSLTGEATSVYGPMPISGMRQ